MTSPTEGLSVTSSQVLRCVACGAPTPPPSGSEILVCTYCGVSQRTVDARDFLDQVTLQVNSFLRQIVPAGFDIGQGSLVDPVARHATFVNSVGPRLQTEFGQYRLRCFQLLSSPFGLLPFSPNVRVQLTDSPRQVAIFDAKVQSVAPLAVDPVSRRLIDEAEGIATAYSSLLVVADLAKGKRPERFHLIHQNLQVAAEGFDKAARWPALGNRIRALSKSIEAIDLIFDARKPGDADSLLNDAEAGLQNAQTGIRAAFDLGYMTSAVDEEIATVRTLRHMAATTKSQPAAGVPGLVFLERLSQTLDWAAGVSAGNWPTTFNSSRFREEVFRMAKELRDAQFGSGTVRTLSMGSGLWVPFWVVELSYTFETGALWAKQGKEVPEHVLLAATFPSDVPALTPQGTRRVLTDVFAQGPADGGIGGSFRRMSGKQERISGGNAIGRILPSSGLGGLGNQPAVPPLSTPTEALGLVQSYLAMVRASHTSSAGQLRLSSPRILDLIYIPCTIGPGKAPLPWLGGLSPLTVGDPAVLGALSS